MFFRSKGVTDFLVFMTRKYPLRNFARQVLIFSLFSSIAPGLVSGQQGLDMVDALAISGRTEEARTVLEIWWNNDRAESGRSDQQRGLWLRAVLTVDPNMATLDYQRLVVEYPGGPYSDKALVRLAMIAKADERLLDAARYYRSLLQDYPQSTERVRAIQWLSDYSEEINKMDSFVAQNETDSLAVGAAHTVQVGAFSTKERAHKLAQILTQAGFKARVVQTEGNSLVRVRIGHFTDLSTGHELITKIERLGYDATIVSGIAKEYLIK